MDRAEAEGHPVGQGGGDVERALGLGGRIDAAKDRATPCLAFKESIGCRRRRNHDDRALSGARQACGDAAEHCGGEGTASTGADNQQLGRLLATQSAQGLDRSPERHPQLGRGPREPRGDAL